MNIIKIVGILILAITAALIGIIILTTVEERNEKAFINGIWLGTMLSIGVHLILS